MTGEPSPAAPLPAARPLTGEAALLSRILPRLALPSLAADGRVEVGPGDDAAVVRLPSDRLVVTTDTLVEGFDFLPHATTPAWIGRKAAVQNLADVAAMGARPLALVVALSAPADTPPGTLEQLSAALAEQAAADGAHVVGGDLGRADRLTLTVTALGAMGHGDTPVLRSGGRAGDVLAIGSDRLGRSAAGLALILAGRARVAPDGTVALEGIRTPGAADLVRHHDAPEVDLSLGWSAGRTAHAMMDLSDGLVRDGRRLAAASQVAIDLDPAALEDDVRVLAALADELGTDPATDPWDWVLHGGEEHAMLAAFAPGEVPVGFRPVGRLLPAGSAGTSLTLGGREVAGEGFDHFG